MIFVRRQIQDLHETNDGKDMLSQITVSFQGAARKGICVGLMHMV